MTLIRKHERVDGKFDREPENHAEIIARFSNGEWHLGWYRKREYAEHFEPLNQSSIEWGRVTAYIDPSEEVAPVEDETLALVDAVRQMLKVYDSHDAILNIDILHIQRVLAKLDGETK